MTFSLSRESPFFQADLVKAEYQEAGVDLCAVSLWACVNWATKGGAGDLRLVAMESKISGRHLEAK